jgi:hypothetical protein
MLMIFKLLKLNIECAVGAVKGRGEIAIDMEA